MARRFQITETEVVHWLDGQRLTYASTSHGHKGLPVRLQYVVGAGVWRVDEDQAAVLVTASLSNAVKMFNELA